jgi:stage II sporulation protein AA (anti-sigma F factor antagonist)
MSEEKNEDHKTTIYIEGELDIFTIDALIKKVDEQTGIRCVLDLNDVNFIDSSGIGLIIRKIIDWQDEGRILEFSNIQPGVKEMLDEMGAFTILKEVQSQ